MNANPKSVTTNRSELVIAFLFFGALAWGWTRIESLPLPKNVLISFLTAVVAVIFFIGLRFCVRNENTRIWSSRVLRSLAIGFLLHGSITVSCMGIYDWFGNWHDVDITRIIDALMSNRYSMQAVASGGIGGAFAVASLTLWKSKLTVAIVALAVALFLFSFLSSGSWFLR